MQTVGHTGGQKFGQKFGRAFGAFGALAARAALALAASSASLAQDGPLGPEGDYVPTPPATPVALADTSPELVASVIVCYRGRMIPANMKAQAEAAGYRNLTTDEIAAAAPGSAGAAEVQGWMEGEGEESVAVVTYVTAIAGRPHSVCVVNAQTPRPEDTLTTLNTALGAPRRDVWNGEWREFSWYWEEDGSYVMADYRVKEDAADATLIVKASITQ